MTTTIDTNWRKGQPVRMLIGRCCPECGAFIMGSVKTLSKRTRVRKCKSCGGILRHVSDDLECKAYIVGIPAG